jgi:UDP-N-acetylmuramoyl-tripeptide--D-alanyl-D-alanine ligase
MNTIWSSKEIIAATRGLSSGEWGITSVSIDTRTLEPGALFVALPGAHVDGHDYVKAPRSSVGRWPVWMVKNSSW